MQAKYGIFSLNDCYCISIYLKPTQENSQMYTVLSYCPPINKITVIHKSPQGNYVHRSYQCKYI